MPDAAVAMFVIGAVFAMWMYWKGSEQEEGGEE